MRGADRGRVTRGRGGGAEPPVVVHVVDALLALQCLEVLEPVLGAPLLVLRVICIAFRNVGGQPALRRAGPRLSLRSPLLELSILHCAAAARAYVIMSFPVTLSWIPEYRSLRRCRQP